MPNNNTPDFIPDSSSTVATPAVSSPDFIPDHQFNPDKEYGTPAEMGKTAIEGALSGITFGGSRQVESHLLGNSKEQAARAKENPGLSITGEFAPMVLMPAKGLVGAVGKAGQAAERVAAPILEKILGSTASKIAAKGAGSAVEGAFYGAGNAVSENALGDADLNAETIMHNIGYGGAIGGGLGTFLGLGSKVLSPRMEKAAIKEMHIENANKASFAPEGALEDSPIAPQMSPDSTAPPKSMEDIEALNAQAPGMEFDASLPAKDAVRQAQQSLAGDMTFLPHGAQVSALDNHESNLRYKMLLKSETPIGQQLRQYEINQKYEGSQKLLPKFIQEIAPEAEITADAHAGGQKAIDDFLEGYNKIKQEEIPNFEKLDSLKTTSVSDPSGVLNGIFEDMPGARDLTYIRPDGSYGMKPWDATSGIQKGAYVHVKEVIKALNKDALTIGDIRNLRDTMLDASKNWEKPDEAFQVNQIRRNLMDYMQNEVQKALPDTEVREFMKRYAINEQNKSTIESIFGGKLDGKSTFGKGVEPEKVLKRIFSSLEDVKAAKALLGDKWNETVANYLSHLHASANDPVKGFSSTKFSRAINDTGQHKGLILNEALSGAPGPLQKIRDVTTIMRALPDSLAGNPSDTASALRILHESKKWGYALFHPGEIPGLVLSTVGDALQSSGERAALDKMLSGQAEETYAAKVQKYNALSSIERMKQKAVLNIKDNVAEMLEGKKFSGVKGLLTQKLTPEEQQKKFAKISKQVTELSTSPERLIDHLQHATRDLHPIAPILATSLGTSMARATQFLASKLPAQDPASPGTPKYQPSTGELYKFDRYYRAIEKPLNTLKEVHAGTLTQESLEALQAVHPKLLQVMQHEMLDQFMDKASTAKIPYATKLSMSMFLGQDLTNSLKPANILGSQMSVFNRGPQEDQSVKPTQEGLKNLNKSEQIMTPQQKSSQRIE